MKAVILAAGVASRLRPLTNNKPKCLLQVGRKCLLGRLLDALISNKMTEVVIVTGYLHEMIRNYIDSHYPGLKVTYIHNERFHSTNNIYSLWLSKPAVLDHDMLLLDSDLLFDPDLLAALLNAPFDNCLALNKHPLGEEEIKVITNSNNQVLEISKTCSIEAAAGESIGIEKFSTTFVNTLFKEMDVMIREKGLSNVFYEAAFEHIIQQGAQLFAVDTTAFFSMELDTVEDFEQACEILPLNLR